MKAPTRRAISIRTHDRSIFLRPFTKARAILALRLPINVGINGKASSHRDRRKPGLVGSEPEVAQFNRTKGSAPRDEVRHRD